MDLGLDLRKRAHKFIQRYGDRAGRRRFVAYEFSGMTGLYYDELSF